MVTNFNVSYFLSMTSIMLMTKSYHWKNYGKFTDRRTDITKRVIETAALL